MFLHVSQNTERVMEWNTERKAAAGTGARTHDARVTTEGGVLPCVFSDSEGGEEEIECGAFTCVSEGCPGLEGLKLWIQPRPSLSR